MHNSNQIHVALASDNNYFEGLLVTAFSIAENCSRPGDIVFHVLNGGILPESIDVLRKTIRKYNCKIDLLSINDKNGISISKFCPYHGSTITYARLLLPDLLPDVDQVVYSDVDTLWIIDIAELWDNLDNDAVVHCVPIHPSTYKRDRSSDMKWYVDHGFKPQLKRLFCAGMVVLNLRLFRKEHLHIKMLELIHNNGGKIPHDDETALNAFMFERGDVKVLDLKWQVGTGNVRFAPEDLKLVLHFAVDTPWKSIHAIHHMLTDAILLWHKHHASIRKITTWQSLRTCNSALDIIAGRVLFLTASNLAPVRWLLYVALYLRGNWGGRSILKSFMTKTNIRRLLHTYDSPWSKRDTRIISCMSSPNLRLSQDMGQASNH